jgi:nitrite reductase/ring-hydroxylating ferredoxin subunit
MPDYEWHIIDSPDLEGLIQTSKTFTTQVKVNGKKLCLVRHKERLYAIDDKCPHAGGPLHQGEINEKCEIICPWHRFPFALETGQSESGGYYVKTYEVKCQNNTISVKMKKKRFLGLF